MPLLKVQLRGETGPLSNRLILELSLSPPNLQGYMMVVNAMDKYCDERSG